MIMPVVFRKWRTCTQALPLSLCLFWTSQTLADPSNSPSEQEEREFSAEAPLRPAEMPLSELPEPPSLDLPAPRPETVEAIEGLLHRIVHEDPVQREQARRELLEAKPHWVAALARQLDKIAERSEKTAMRTLLEQIRREARSGSGSENRDYLDLVLAAPAPHQAVWRDLAQILSVSRMLATIGSMEAGRELIRVYVRFGEFLRIDTQLQLDKLGDRSIAALIEAQRHPAPRIASWAKARLDLLGKAIAHEAVRTEDQAALADILVALGRTRNPDNARVLISFASTERAQIRTAARQGIHLLGEVTAWQLRDAYLDTTGKRAPREWTWKRIARELFTEYDRLRSAKLFEIFEQGRAAEKEKNWELMKNSYDHVLALSPLFERRELMTAGYFSYVESVRETDPQAALSALRRIERIAEEETERKRAESLRYVLEAAQLEQQGMIDRGLLDKAIALDPQNPLVQDALDRTSTQVSGWSSRTRFLLTGAIFLLSLAGAAWILGRTWLRRRQNPHFVIQFDETDSPPSATESDSFTETDSPPDTAESDSFTGSDSFVEQEEPFESEVSPQELPESSPLSHRDAETDSTNPSEKDPGTQ